MPSYRATLRFLYGLQLRGVKLGLSNTRALLRVFEQPHRAFPTIHVAGTNGKGSTCAFIASILQEAGFRTGLYTSPHLVRFTERIRINGQEMPEEALVGYARRLRPEIERRRATFFEATTCIALKFFADEHVDVAVIETGLGGRFDSTNVIRPVVSVITNISLEHTELLGSTIRAIAREKAGIIKRHVPVVTATGDPSALGVFRASAKERGSRLVIAGSAVSIRKAGESHLLRLPGRKPLRVRLGFAGTHQERNASLAVAALHVASRTGEGAFLRGSLVSSAIRSGLLRVGENSGLRGRLERFRHGRRLYIVDVAHNPAGMKTLAAALSGKRIAAVVFGMLRDKDVSGMLPAAAAIGGRLLFVTPRTPRGIAASSLVRMARRMDIDARSAGSVEEGLRVAKKCGPGAVVVCGSHYVVGPALEALGLETA